ncbi:uncharacterized protein LOC110042123 [Orbicella faveolata]|uniref:uncharacterized protein LOC110042123 n=2 Tax=Orbicella faveolata TaxID=48498 RepID=UPI0009E4A262|nr:uncharacterized protein LOC110042123 [Orbicella faveolata]
MDEEFRCDSWLSLLEDILQREPEWNSDYSKDFPSFPLKKPKLEVDRDEVLDRPLYIKQDSEDFSFPNKVKCSMPCIITQPKVKVHFLGLKKEYEKVQSRVNRQSRQRLAEGKVRMVVTADAQIAKIEVLVERAPMAAALSGDVTGRVPLKVKMGAQVGNKQYLSVDLDSVYMSDKGTPVYKLSTVDADRRNRFRLVVSLLFIDGDRSQSFASPTFLLRSRRPERKKSY